MQQHDTHFHLDLFDNPKQILQKIEEAMIYTIAVTNLPDLFDFTHKLTSDTKYVRAALGFHPELCALHMEQLNLFMKKLPLTKYIGEIGLDNYNKTPSDFSAQKKVFERIISSCNEQGGKILTVHSRRAEEEVISIIGRHSTGKVILHWYSGSLKELDRALTYGYYFSINYAMTKSESGKKIISRIPVDRILIETDGPFVKFANAPSTPLIAKIITENVLAMKGQKSLHTNPNFIEDNFKTLIT